MRVIVRLHTITRSTAQFLAALPGIDIPSGQSFGSPVSQPALSQDGLAASCISRVRKYKNITAVRLKFGTASISLDIRRSFSV
jgi:hypothetical protein